MIYLLISLTIFALVVFTFFISGEKFRTRNPISTGYGLIQILATNRDYVKLQNSPQVYLSKPDNAHEMLINMMQKDGFAYSEDKRLGSLLVFEKAGKEQSVFFSVNGYYSLWAFN